MPEQLWFTKILNAAFASPVDAFLRLVQNATHLPVEPQFPQAPITNTFAMELIVFGFLLLLFILVRSQLSVESPGGLQHVFETFSGFIEGQSRDVIGAHSEGYTPFLVALGFFILISNLLGVIPGLESPTSDKVVPLGCAVCVFIYYHAHGFRHAGLRYLKHFLGPSDPSMPLYIRIPVGLLMLVIEPISHLARVMSLTVRLYGNIFAGDMVILVFLSLIPIAVPVVFIGLHIGVALIQTYVFVLLAIVYLAGAVAEEH